MKNPDFNKINTANTVSHYVKDVSKGVWNFVGLLLNNGKAFNYKDSDTLKRGINSDDTGFVQFDLITSENYTYASDIADMPVEDNSVISDNITNKPIEVSLSGIIFDKKTGDKGYNFGKRLEKFAGINSLINNSTPMKKDYLRTDLIAIINSILKVRNTKKPITLCLSTGLFENMVITSFSYSRDKDKSFDLFFNMTLREVKIVGLKTYIAPDKYNVTTEEIPTSAQTEYAQLFNEATDNGKYITTGENIGREAIGNQAIIGGYDFNEGTLN